MDSDCSSLLTEAQFLCPICLDVFTHPVTTTCGHNYCKACITDYWDSNDACQCPICMKVFDKAPELKVNTFISEMVARFRKSVQVKRNTGNANREPAKPDEVSCDVCAEPKPKALKSCLVCLASYCEVHLELHQRVTGLKQHKLIDPVNNLEDMMCKKHDRPLELFCKTDCVCVCRFCTESDHMLHQFVSLKEEYEEKKAELEKTDAEVQQMIQERKLKIQEINRVAELSRKAAASEIADGVQVFTALMSCIKRSQAELVNAIQEKQNATKKQADAFINELQQEIAELEKRSAGLRQLSHTEEHVHLLCNFASIRTPIPTKEWTKVNVNPSSPVGTVRRALAQLEKMLGKEMENKLRDAELKRIQQYAVDVTLDPGTAQRKLILSEDGKQVKHGDLCKDLPDNKERFSICPSVLGKQCFSSGRYYFEVQVQGKTDWALGVARMSINKKVKITLCPNKGYWTIWLRNGSEYEALADTPVYLPVREKLQKVGVFVDYEEGLVSFYDVVARLHIYSFTGCGFTEKLFPYFSPHFNKDGKNSAPLIISSVNYTNQQL